MVNTVVGVYDDYGQAKKASDELIKSGFSSSAIQITSAADSPDARRALLRDTEQGDNQQVTDQTNQGWGIGNFFSMIFGNDTRDEHVDIYSEAIRRGSYLLSVDADNDEQRRNATDILNRYDPVDIDDRASQWRREGWSTQRDATPARQENTAPENIASRSRVRVFPRASNPSASDATPMQTAQTGTKDQGGGHTNEAECRAHWQATYGGRGGRYEDYMPAYRYGRTLADNEKYSTYRWNDLEPEARREWESKNSDSPWESIEKAVRFGSQKWRE